MFKQILNKFDKEYVYDEFENLYVGVMLNDKDNYNFIQFINGLNVTNGGAPIEWVENKLINEFKNLLPKKYDKLKIGDVKNKLTLVVVFKNMKNPRFSDQVKSVCVNTYTQFKDIVSDVNFKKLAKSMYQNKTIKNEICSYFDLKEEFEARKALKNLVKPTKKRIKNDKFISSIGTQKRLMIVEGDSAAGGLSKMIGRDGTAYFGMMGIPPNAWDLELSKIPRSKKLVELGQILGFSFNKEIQQLDYDIVIATDQDMAGVHIRGLLLGMFYRFGKNLFDENKIKILQTPLILLKDKKETIKHWFYDFESYNEFVKTNNSNFIVDYKKGLGSWDVDEFSVILEKDGLENMIETLTIGDDDICLNLVDTWFNGKRADDRKELLKTTDFSIQML